MARFADVEAVVVTHLTATVGATSTALPGDLEGSLPRTRVAVGGGSDDGVTDEALVDVESFADTRAGAADLAEDSRQAMLGLAASTAGGPLVDWVRTATRPVWVDYKNPAVHRFVATYRVALRRP